MVTGPPFGLELTISGRVVLSSSQRCAPIFSSHRRANTGPKHVVRVRNHMQKKTLKKTHFITMSKREGKSENVAKVGRVESDKTVD